MALINCPECQNQISDKANCCPRCGCPIQNAPVVSTTQTNKLPEAYCDPYSKETVIEFLSYASHLEKTIYTYRKLHQSLEEKIQTLAIPRKIKKDKNDILSLMSSLGMTIGIVAFFVALLVLIIRAGDIWGDILSILSVALIFFNSALLSRIGTALLFGVGIFAAFFVIGIILSVFAAISNKRNYIKKVNIEKSRLNHEKNAITLLRSQQDEIQKQIDDNSALLNRLYDLDVIFPSYRHMVAVITMLEYFQSGRCAQLSGPNGAYNKYSSEELQRVIITKLDQIVNLLEDIKTTQRMIYDAIQESNYRLTSIMEQNEQLISENKSISKNTALTAYNTEIIRHNTSISAYVDVFC